MKKSILILTIGLALAGCSKEESNHACYDRSLVHNGACTTDCPGFEGCDGIQYCNACVAARSGIGPR